VIVGCEERTEFSNTKPESINEIVDPIPTFDNMFRMGPVLFKFDKEWVINDTGQKYIRVGIGKQDIYSGELDSNYDLVSPESLSFKVIEKAIIAKNDRHNTKEILSYDIKCNDAKLWIDYNFIIANRYDKQSNQNIVTLVNPHDLYFYHPVVKNWWGNNIRGQLALLMWEDMYDDSITVEKVFNLYRNVDNTDILESIINKRTLNLPSMSFFNGNFKKVNKLFSFYCWYVEKENVAPKNSDDE